MTEKHASNEQIKKEWAAQASSKEIADAVDAAKQGIGHNSLTKNPEMVADFDYLMKLKADAKAISDEMRQKVATMKEKYGYPAGAIRVVLRNKLRDKASLAQEQQATQDIYVQIGFDLLWKEPVSENGEEDPIEVAKTEAEASKPKKKNLNAVK